MAKPKFESTEYRRLREIGKDYHGEKSDCSVISFAAALEIPYKESLELCSDAGRKPRRGMDYRQIIKALKNSNREYKITYGYEWVKNYKYSTKLTFNNCIKVLDKSKNYIVIGDTHMAAVKRGQVVDWAEGRKYHIYHVVEIGEKK